MNVSASWLGDSQIITRPNSTFDFDEPSICFDENGTMYYLYTQNFALAGLHEIYFGNTSAGKELSDTYDLNDLCLTGGSGGIYNMSDCNYGDIAYSNGTIHMVWQGIPESAGDHEIAYTYTNNTNGEPLNNIIEISNSADDGDYDPTITALDNDTIFIAFYDSTTGTDDVRMSTNFAGGSITNLVDPRAGRTGHGTNAKPKLSAFVNETYWRIDLAYIDTSNNIAYNYLEKGDDSLADMQGRDATIDVANAITDLDIDSGPDMAAFCFVADEDIWVANSTALGSPKLIENNAITEGDPDVVINDNHIITAFFVRNYTDDNQIISVDNYATFFDNQDAIITKTQLPDLELGTVTGAHISGLDAELCQGDQVIILYDAREEFNAEFKYHRLFVTGYGNLYNDGDGDYNQYSWEETLGDSIYSKDSIIEGIQISYNVSSGNDVPIKIKLTDMVTNQTWENTTILDGAGGYVQKIRFWNPNGSYFIAQNPFWVEILNGSTMDDLVKIEVDPLLFSNGTANSTSDYENGTVPYMVHYENTDLHFTIFLFDYFGEKGTTLRREDNMPPTDFHSDTFDSDNYIDLFKFYMEGGEKYNMSITTTGAGSNNSCRFMIFNDSQQITDPSKAIYNITINSTNNGTYVPLSAASSKTYYVVIQNLVYNESYSYTFDYRVCPFRAKLISPSSNEYVNANFWNFEWDEHDDEGSSLNIHHYDLLTFADDDLVNPIVKEYGLTTKNQTIEITDITGGHSYPSYVHSQGVHYMNVTIYTDDGQISDPSTHVFNLDFFPPESPVVSPGIGKYSVGEYWVNWTIPDDNPTEFDVDYYELYRGYSRDFTCDPSTRLGFDFYFNTTYEYGLDSDVYYYKVIAVDHVGLKSPPSECVGDYGRYVVSLSGFVDPQYQTFSVLPGDFLEYQIVDIIDEGNKDPNALFTTFMGRTFQLNTLLHYYITFADADEVIPVEGTMYRKWMNTTSIQQNAEFELLGTGIDLFPLVTSSNITYQGQIFDLFLARQFGIELSTVRTVFENNTRESWYFDSFQALEVIVHTYTKAINYDKEEIADINFLYDSAIFVVDKNSGVLIEMTIYDYTTEKGFSIKLVDTNIGLTSFDWWWLPFLIIGFLGIIAALINQIVKKMERRV